MSELLNEKRVSDATLQVAIDKFGERTVAELTAFVGFYNFVSLILNVDGYPLPDGVKPELKPLREH